MPTYELAEVPILGVKRRPEFRTLLIMQSASGELSLRTQYEVRTFDESGNILTIEMREAVINEAAMRSDPDFRVVYPILKRISRKTIAEEYPELVIATPDP